MNIDMEKVVSGLETCKSTDKTCSDCPYNGEVCTTSLCDDVLSLLKEQEEMLVEYSAFGGMKYGGCPRCNARIDNLVNQKACGFCGQAVKWE